jgi:hypothetical protein
MKRLPRWALVKDRDVAKKMTKFIELNTIGVSKDSQLRAAKVLRAVSDAYELPGAGEEHRLFDYGRRKMAERWSMLREAAAASGIFSLPDETSGYCNFTKDMASTNPGMYVLLLPCLNCQGMENCKLCPPFRSPSHRARPWRACARSVRVAALRQGGRGGLRELPPGPQDPDAEREPVRGGPEVRPGQHAGQGRRLRHLREASRLPQVR